MLIIIKGKLIIKILQGFKVLVVSRIKLLKICNIN